ncbi:hypothetical protein RhiirA4_480212 [Rhizophagus irregularis]|uniref:Uncharacterized protein n=1 Tax=Rhizophagus irregularis TaxID=588596 RepID=A0A2I1HHL1_9GLOM|nr:hypothetical protein RhiirA4_480212 [Rhizophagus irregularis]
MCEDYRNLVSISYDLPYEWKVSAERKEITYTTNPEIYLRISGDGRNVGRKVKQVMITCLIIDDIDNLYWPKSHHTTILYSGIKKYETLHIVLEPLIVELKKLKEEGLKNSQNIKWKIELYFLSDWKFLAICLEINVANSNEIDNNHSEIDNNHSEIDSI